MYSESKSLNYKVLSAKLGLKSTGNNFKYDMADSDKVERSAFKIVYYGGWAFEM